MTNLIGPDVSFYQDDPNTKVQIDFPKMKSAGASFVIIRAGQNTWVDTDFEYNWKQAGDAGLPRGAYFFYDSRVSPETQVNTWMKAMNGGIPECGAWMDFEDRYGGPHGKESHFREFAERVKDAFPTQVEVGVYTGPSYWKERIKDFAYWHQYPLWIANYEVTKPGIPPPWTADEWTFWQYTDRGDGHKYGAESSRIDLNYFNGDEKKFADMFGLSAPLPPTPLRTMIVSVIDSEGGVYSGELWEQE